MYMYIVHIKITLHFQVLVCCKNVPTHLIVGGPTQNLSYLFYTAKKVAPATNQNVHDANIDLHFVRFCIGLIWNDYHSAINDSLYWQSYFSQKMLKIRF